MLSFPELTFFLPILFSSVQTVTVLVGAEIKPSSLLDLGECSRSPKHAESQICVGFNMVKESYWTSSSFFFFLLLNGLLTRPRDQRLLWLIFTLLL